jgi:membrane protein YqaA with SNARE-associated domain
MKSLYKWASKTVYSPYASFLFFSLVFIEAFFFMPSSTLYIIYALEKRNQAFFYAILAIAASICGAAIAYLLGIFLWDSVGSILVQSVMKPETFTKLVFYYQKYQITAVLAAGFLPLPYKAITLTAGFCKIPFMPFLISCAIARGARFLILAGAIIIWGEQIQQILDRYFYYLVVLGICILAVSGWLLH